MLSEVWISVLSGCSRQTSSLLFWLSSLFIHGVVLLKFQLVTFLMVAVFALIDTATPISVVHSDLQDFRSSEVLQN